MLAHCPSNEFQPMSDLEITPFEDRAFSIAEAMEHLKVSRATLHRRVKDGSIEVVKFGGRVLITGAAIRKALAGN
jgi:excisionase family DNA binding protein